MPYKLPDNLDLYDQHEARQQQALEQLPRCSECDNPIQDDYYYEINDEVICTECLNRDFRKSVDDYIG